MLTCIVVVLVLLNSFQIFSITHASSDGVISQILFEETGMSMFETILKNMPSNQSNYELLHATKIVDTCLNDLMQIRAELQSLDINALQSEFESVEFYEANIEINRKKRHSGRFLGKTTVWTIDWESI